MIFVLNRNGSSKIFDVFHQIIQNRCPFCILPSFRRSKVLMTKGSFTRTINVTVFMSGTFDLFNVICKQHNRAALKPFEMVRKTVTLAVSLNEA